MVDEQHSTPPITYYALDLNKPELERTLSELAASDVGNQLQGKVATKGMWGTYDGGLKFIQEGGLHGRNATNHLSEMTTFDGLREMSPISYRDSGSESPGTRSSVNDQDSDHMTSPSTPGTPQTSLNILFLGSSLGNFNRGDDANFLRDLPLRPNSGDTLLLGLDHDNDPTDIELAYNDRLGITRKFILQGNSFQLHPTISSQFLAGLEAAGAALGDETMFSNDKWDYFSKYNQEKRW